ncbi:pyruvate carboxylase [Coniochaeta pulveracea]|uniref:Pyruvate carboxylase n=1 Tax=Coniochaeta pulveracea TaxID=177199 RepID=A0A420Y803_9PEZI|nr:pyruvate carboxylase [Coniochaeta pulveracea]
MVAVRLAQGANPKTCQGFLPSCGTITYSELPAGPGIRLDGYNLFAGAEITPHYDPMLFKLIVRADDLASARTKMLAALGATHIEGVETNIYLLERILQDDRFVKQQYFTRSLDQDVVASKVKNNSDDVTAQRLLTFFAESLVNGTQIQGQIGKPGTFQQLEVPGLRRTLATADRHAANGKVANGYGSDGNGINGPIPNGHIPNGHTPNGHTPIGHAPNGHAPNGHAPNGHAPNGHTTNSDGHSRLTINGHGSVGHDIEGYNQDGWRGVLLAEGPKAFAARVRQHPRVLLTDTTWRDAQQSLLATRVRTVDLANIAPDTNIAFSKAYSLECWGGATFDVALRFLHEDPWKRLATLRRLVPDVPFQMLLRSVSGLAYSAVPQNFLRHFCRQAVKNGMDIIRVFDGLNDLTNLSVAIDACLSAGAVVEAAILYTGDMMDPACKYSLSYYLELVDHLVLTGAHIIAIKSMSGVWKPRAAFVLVSEIRKRHPDIPIHVHTHDAAGTGVATMLACVEAGADIIDGAIDSMSGTTSQPALSALIAGLADRDDEPEISLDHVRAIDSYWAQLRVLYAGFDAKLSGPDPDVYLHEIPGGQLTNLMFQARELGLGSQWKETKAAFVDANRLLGNIIKATPTSKAVGDLAQFMVNSDLAHDDVLARADTLDFPDSVLDFFEGLMGRPFDGFPEPLRTRVLARAGRTKSAKGQVSTCLEPVDLDAVKQQLRIKYGDSITETDVCSHVMFPDVFAQYRAYLGRFGDVSQLPSQQMLAPPKIGAEMKCPIPGGRGLTVQVLAVQPPAEGDEDSGERTVFFRVNGRYRQVTVRDLSVQNQKRRRPADPGVPSQIGSPFSGVISAIAKDAGSRVSKGDVIMSISAMKMIINVSAPFDGVLRDMDASVGESVERGDLLFVIAN